MNPLPTMLNPEEERAVLSAALWKVYGDGAHLEDWTAALLTKRGRHRAVRYHLRARVAAVRAVQNCQWVAKFYERDDDARKVGTLLRELATTDWSARRGLVTPTVVAYYAPRRLLLLTYESGESVISAIARHKGSVLSAIGSALAALHAAPVTLDAVTTPASLVVDLRHRAADLCARFPGETVLLRSILSTLERRPPLGPAAPPLLHGDLGPAQLLWRMGNIVVLDMDKCTRGDPALDLGNLMTQLRRLTLRKPGKLPHFDAVRTAILDAYQRRSPPDPTLAERVSWYEQITLMRKIHFLAFDTTRRQRAAAMRQRQAEAIRLLGVCDGHAA